MSVCDFIRTRSNALGVKKVQQAFSCIGINQGYSTMNISPTIPP